MSEFIFKLPDLGEGTVEAEIIEWHVKPGDVIAEGQIIVDVMTDKASIEVPSPASGRVLRTSGGPGDMVTVGTELIAIETDASAPVAAHTESAAPPQKTAVSHATAPASPPAERELPQEPGPETSAVPAPQPVAHRPADPDARVLAPPALRKLASELGVDLSTVRGTGPRGRILRRDLEGLTAPVPATTASPMPAAEDVSEIRVIGVRRVIAERMQAAKREIPHFAYVEEIDMTALESLRKTLNAKAGAEEDRLTFLPFIAIALIRALRDFPQCNALHDSERGVLRRFASVHLGVATQTPDGLKVPVVHHANRLDLRGLATAINVAADKARNGTATRQELTGSTFTLTSLGRLGGIVSTPVINAPEMGIVGVNKAVERPMVLNGRIEIRLMMNLSSSFDHRFVDGFDAASMIQAVKQMLEEPALLFV